MATAYSSAPKEAVTAALLVIGGKILSGRTKDQNIGYIAEYLTAVGIDLKEVRVVGDEEKAIIDALNALRHRCTYVFTTGGIGPTHGHHRRLRGEGVRYADRQGSARARHPARMGEDDRRQDERGTPPHDTYSQGRGSHSQQGVGGVASGSVM
jgi:hypothetical protein